MDKRDQMEIAIAGDSNYLVPLTVLLKSIFVNNKDSDITVNFLYITSGIQESDLVRLEEFITANGHRMRRIAVTDEQLEMIPESRHTKNASLRLLLPELLPSHVSKVLYLDGDVVVCGSLLSLFQTDMDDFYVAGVKDSANILSRDHLHRIGFPEDAAYFNTGIILLNIQRMRRENILQAIYKYLEENADVTVAVDQDTLNVMLHKAVNYIPPIYNYNFWLEKDVVRQLFTREEITAAKRQPVIVHYIGPVKPWNCKSIHPKKSLWWKYLKQTPYKDFRSKDRTLKNRMTHAVLLIFVKPVKSLLTVKHKQQLGRLLPAKIKQLVKKQLAKAQ